MRSERTNQMLKNFISLFQQGFTIKQIASKYGLSTSTVYLRLEEIANSNGLSREDLLKEIHKTPTYWARQDRVVFANVKTLQESLNDAEENISKVIQDIEKILAEEKETNYEM